MSESPKSDTRNSALAVVVGVAIAASLILWATGELLSLGATGHFTGIGVIDGLGLVLLVLLNPGDPAQAWPEAHRPDFPPTTYWIVCALMIFGLAMFARRVWGPAGEFFGRNKRPDAARWAKPADVKDLIVAEPTPGRITLGRLDNGALLAAQSRHSLAVIGPTQTGKTTGFAEPAILEWQGPAIITSIKTDLLDHTIGHRAHMGDVYVYDPAQLVDLHARHSWSPLARCETYDGAQAQAKTLVTAAKRSMGASGESDFWYQSAETLIAPYLLAARLGDFDVAKVIQWIARQEEDEPVAVFLEEEREDLIDDCTRAMDALYGVLRSEPGQRSSIFTTARTALLAYQDSRVLNTARRSEITAEKLLGGGSDTIYLCAPMHEQERLQPLYSTLITEMINAVYEQVSRTGKALDPPLLLVLDEAANIAPLDKLAEYATTCASMGIQLVSIFHDLSQIRRRWGDDAMGTIVSNHRGRLFLCGNGDDRTLEYVARVTGDAEVRQASHTDGRAGHKSTTESTTYRSLAPANVVREMPEQTGVLIYHNKPPALIHLRPWYDDPDLLRMVETKPPDPPTPIPPDGAEIDPATGEVLEVAP